MSQMFEPDVASAEISECLNLNNPQSFFLFAGAGSGKTRTLVEGLKRFKTETAQRLRRNGQKVAVITYTNAACDEIKRRLDFDNSFAVSTIHSFAWELIRHYQNDIRPWVEGKLKSDLGELQSKSSRPGTKTELDRCAKIESKQKRLAALPQVRKFQYNPNGDNIGRDSLSHDEVIGITKDFLVKPLMQKIFIRQYPVLLVDESQDTKKDLMDAFFDIQINHENAFVLGLFGDMMQRIYSDGKQDLGSNLPPSWAKPSKTINYRCPKRIIRLINKIRSAVDDKQQESGPNNEDGIVRLFLVKQTGNLDKTSKEHEICAKMAEICSDAEWGNPQTVKTLALEHKMLAKRGGFSTFFDPLYANDKLKTGLLNGDLSGVSLFSERIRPLLKAKRDNDTFAVATIVKKYSSLVKPDVLKKSASPKAELEGANKAVSALFALWDDNMDPSLLSITREMKQSGLFDLTDTLNIIASRSDVDNNAEAEAQDEKITAWENALNAPFSQLERYADYIAGNSRFGTHQGIKGLEFPHVMVILDDNEANGFLFSYEKLLGVKELSDTDRRNANEGKETSLDRTRRLFYVTCSRAQKSLAVVAYTDNVQSARSSVVHDGWFEKNEILTV